MAVSHKQISSLVRQIISESADEVESTSRVQLRLPNSFVDQIDMARLKDKVPLTRSEYMIKALRYYIDNQ